MRSTHSHKVTQVADKGPCMVILSHSALNYDLYL